MVLVEMSHEPCKSRGVCYHSKAGKVGGPICGRKSVESGWWQSEAGRKAASSGGKIGGKIQGPKNVESGLLRSVCSQGGKIGGVVSGRLAAERGQIQLHSGNGKGAAALRKRLGPNKEEAKLRAELLRLHVEFEPEVVLGYGIGVADILAGTVIGELDGGAHYFGALGKKGIAWLEEVSKYWERDLRHDAVRVQHGYIVIRDSDPVRLAARLREVVV